MFHLIILFLILINSYSYKFAPIIGFGFRILAAVLFPINSPVASAALGTTVFEAVFRASSFVRVAVSSNYFPYLLNIFLANDKNLYPSGVKQKGWGQRERTPPPCPT